MGHSVKNETLFELQSDDGVSGAWAGGVTSDKTCHLCGSSWQKKEVDFCIDIEKYLSTLSAKFHVRQICTSPVTHRANI